MEGITLHDRSRLAPSSDGHRSSGSEQSLAVSRVLSTLTSSDGLTRADVADRTSLPRSTVSAAVRRLVEQNLVEEFTHGASTGGRPPTLLRAVRKEGAVFVGELGVHHARIGLATLDGQVLMSRSIPVEVSDGEESAVALLAESWSAMARKVHVPVIHIGLGVPGPVDQQGRVTNSARMPTWNGLDLRGDLTRALGLPSVVMNDAHAAAVGEWVRCGEDADSSCIYIKAGTGIGAGWISGGVMHRGSHGFAGDITHARIQTDNPRPCSCGNSGCMETVASGAAILQRLRELGIDAHGPADIVTIANSGDPQVTKLIRDAGARIGEVISVLVNFLNPTRIVLGGSLSQVGALLAGLRTELYKRCLPSSTRQLSIDTSIAGADAPLIGMAILARQFLNTGSTE